MKYLNVTNPYLYTPPNYGLINLYNIIPIMFTILIVLILLNRYVGWYSKRPKYIEHRKLNGWKRSMPIYRGYCEKHGYYETHLQGYDEILICTECISERDDKYVS